MARPRIPYNESATKEVYDQYKSYVDRTGEIPNPNVFLNKILIKELGYTMGAGTFAYHWLKLQLRGLIHVNEVTHAITGPEIKGTVKNVVPDDY